MSFICEHVESNMVLGYQKYHTLWEPIPSEIRFWCSKYFCCNKSVACTSSSALTSSTWTRHHSTRLVKPRPNMVAGKRAAMGFRLNNGYQPPVAAEALRTVKQHVYLACTNWFIHFIAHFYGGLSMHLYIYIYIGILYYIIWYCMYKAISASF